MIIAGAGHRPDKLGGYDSYLLMNLRVFAQQELQRINPKTVISGMALGWDMAIAAAAVNLDIPLIAAVPFDGQELRWPSDKKRIYKWLLSKAKSIHIVSRGGYAPYKMQRRNRWMVDQCDMVLALWNGTQGGTYNCIQYAHERRKPVENVWIRWTQYR